MDDPEFVRGVQGIDDLSRDWHDLADRQGRGGTRETISQRFTLHQLENEYEPSIQFFDPMKRRDIGMVQGGEHLRFAQQAGAAPRVSGKRIRQHLERDQAAEADVACAIHLSHAAGSDRADNLVGPDFRAGRQAHQPPRDISEASPQTAQPKPVSIANLQVPTPNSVGSWELAVGS
jgi:hypothetical protein